MIQLLIFAIGSAALIVLSWPSLRDRSSHGFYRFFAFEAALALVLLNAQVWFRRPFSPQQIASWLLLLSSAILAVHGFHMLRRIGQPEGDFENTTVLVTSGAYRYIGMVHKWAKRTLTI